MTKASTKPILSIMKQTLGSILDFLSSLKITVIGLSILFLLILWGTIYQIDNGIYLAKRDIFYTWFITVGIIPLPGGILIFAVLGINMTISMFRRIPYKWKNIGLFIMHWGLILLLVGALQIHYFSEEGMIGLWEGGETDLIYLSNEWNVNLLNDNNEIIKSIPFDNKINKSIKNLLPSKAGIEVQVLKFADSALPAYAENSVLNSSGIRDFKVQKGSDSAMIPGLILQFTKSEQNIEILLFGGDSSPTVLDSEAGISLQLKEESMKLPFSLKLKDFSAFFYQETEMPKSFTSNVELTKDGFIREATISMNTPLRTSDFTIYQTSYQVDQSGKEASIFTVVKNGYRLFPYIVSIIITIGLILHFILSLTPFKERIL